MPAKSKSQQRLFGMVHAYQKGEFHGSKELRNRIRTLSKHVSTTDAQHFAQTPHKDLPETKEAQFVMRPDEANAIYSQLSSFVPPADPAMGSAGRRSFLRRIIPGAAIGAVVGGVGMGLLGRHMGSKVLSSGSSLSPDEAAEKLNALAVRCGLWGAGRGAVAGAGIGLGLGVMDKVMGR